MKRKHISFFLALALAVTQVTFTAIAEPGDTVYRVRDGSGNLLAAENNGSKRIHIYPTIDEAAGRTLKFTYNGREFTDKEDLNDTLESAISDDGKTLTITLSEGFEAKKAGDCDLTVQIDGEDEYQILVSPVSSWDVTVTGGGKGKVTIKDSDDAYSVDKTAASDKSGSCVAELGGLTLTVQPETGSKIKDISIEYKHRNTTLDIEKVFKVSSDTASSRTYTLQSGHEQASAAYKVKVTFELQGKESALFTAVDKGGRTLKVEKGEDMALKSHPDLPEGAPGKDEKVSTYHIYFLQDEEDGAPVVFAPEESNELTVAAAYSKKLDIEIKDKKKNMELDIRDDYSSSTNTKGGKYAADFFFVVDDAYYYNGILYPSAQWDVTITGGGSITVHEEGRKDGPKSTLSSSGKVITESSGYDIVFTVKPGADNKLAPDGYKFEGIDAEKLEVEETDDGGLVITIDAEDVRSKRYEVAFEFEGGDVDITPDAPTGLEGSTQYNIVYLEWDGAAHAQSYNVYMKKSGEVDFHRIQHGVSEPHARVSGLGPGAYVFVVTAVNGEKESGRSNQATVEVVGATIGDLDPPAGLKAASTTTVSATVAWDKVAGATVGYYVYWSQTDYGPYQTSPLLTATSYTITGLEPGQTIYVFAASVGDDGISVKSDSLKVTTKTGSEGNTGLGVPSNLKITGTTNTSISLTWDEVADATGYNVYWSDSYSGSYDVGDVDGNGCTIYELDASTLYYVYITATNAEGEGKSSITLAAKTDSRSTTSGSTGGTGGTGSSEWRSGYVVSTSKSTAQIESMSGSGYEFRVGLPLLGFLDAYVDGQRLQRGTHYSLREGSTILSLKDDYADSLSNGTHTLRMDFSSANATTEFIKDSSATGAATIAPVYGDAGSNVTYNPKTGR